MHTRCPFGIVAALGGFLLTCAAPARLAAATYYVSSAAGDDGHDGLAARWDGTHGPWKSLARASSVVYAPGDSLLLRCGDIWDETLTLRGDGTPEQPVTVSSYGAGERPYIRRTIGQGQECIVLDDACGYRFRDLELGCAFAGIHVRTAAKRRTDYPFYRFEDCFFHDIDNPKCPDEGEPWAWAIWWEGPGLVRDIRVERCIGLRTLAFFNGGVNRGDVVFDRDTISHGSYNQVFQSETRGFDILNCVFAYNYPWRYDKFGITQVIAGNLEGGPGVHYDVRNNEFGWAGDYPGSPDGCGYDFEVSSNGVTFQNNFVHNSYGEAVLFMGGMRQQNMLFADNVFRDNVRFSPRWQCTIALFPSVTGSGTFRNNALYLWPGKKAFESKPTCFTYENNDEHPTKPFVAMPLVTHIGHAGSARVYTFSCATPGATIRYTTDAGLPSASSPVYTRPIVVKRSGVLNVKAFKSGYWPSYVNSLAVELRASEGKPPTATWQPGKPAPAARRLAAIADTFTVSCWVRPTAARKPTPEMGSGCGLAGVDWWKLDEGAGSTVTDCIGGCPGSLTGATWSKAGGTTTLAFNGKNASVSFGGTGRQSVSNNFTIAFWAAPEATRASTPEAASGASGVKDQRYALFPQQYSAASGEAGCGVSVGTNGVSVFELADNYLPSPLVADRPLTGWHHITVAYRSGQPSLYVDGVLEKTGLKSGKRVHPDFNMGGNMYGWYQGKLRDVRVYPRALGDAEIRDLAAPGSSASIPWTLDKSAGTLGLPYALAPVRRGGGSGADHAGMGVSVGTNGITICEASDDYQPSMLVDNRPLAGWKHIAVVYRDKQPSLYLDGVFEKAGCRSTKTVHPAFTIGKGAVRDVRVYDHVLTDAEIQVLATAPPRGTGR